MATDSKAFIYTRVSTAEQTTDAQMTDFPEDVLSAVPERRRYSEVISGTVPAFDRQVFARMLERLEQGDALHVSKLDRLGRDTADILATVDHLKSLGVRLVCQQFAGLDLTTATGAMVMTVLAAVATMERELIVERTKAGQLNAWNNGKQKGRPAKVTDALVQAIKTDRDNGMSIRQLASAHKVSTASIQRALKGLAG